MLLLEATGKSFERWASPYVEAEKNETIVSVHHGVFERSMP